MSRELTSLACYGINSFTAGIWLSIAIGSGSCGALALTLLHATFAVYGFATARRKS